MGFTEDDLRAAFHAGWKARNRNPGLKRVRKKSLNNAILGMIGGDKHSEYALIPDDRKYHNSIWLKSEYRKTLMKPKG